MATICFYCVICGTRLQASSELVDNLMECHACTRHVPVPKLASLHGNGGEYLPVLPPEVLEFSLAFECGHCHSRLSADARWEGRGVDCPKCSARTEIPRWSTGLRWAGTPGAGRPVPMPAMHQSMDLHAAELSRDEIEFLSASESRSQGTAV